MKTYVAASDEVLNGDPSRSLYISYFVFEENNERVRVVWVFHSSTLPALVPTTWEEVVKKLPNPESISFNESKGILIFNPDEKRWE